MSAISSSDSAPSIDTSTTTAADIAPNDKAALMPGEEDGDEGEAEDEANVMLPVPPGTLTTPGSLLFAPLLESRFGNLLPGCTPATGDELQYMVERKLVGCQMLWWLVVVMKALYPVRDLAKGFGTPS
jgi:hypothetical protein